MKFVASELREYMSKLGVKTVDELVGRIDLIKRKEGITGQAAEVDLSNILATNFIKFITYSGLPQNLFLSSGFCVATPNGQVCRGNSVLPRLIRHSL